MTASEPPGDVVDAHVHLWDIAQMRISWFHDDLGLPRRVTARDLADVAVGTRVRCAVAVQAADTVREAHWLMEQSREHHPMPGPVVVQYESRSVLESDTERQVAGIRVSTPTGAADLSDIAGLDQLCEGLAASGRVLELLIRPIQLAAVGELATRHPGLDVVVCHVGLGARAPDRAWADGLARAARHENVSAKLSGIVTSADGDDVRTSLIARTALDSLGAERLLFGSDWPMSERVAAYPQIVERTTAALPALTDAGERAVWSGNAVRLYVRPG